MKRTELALIWQHGRVYSVANVLNRSAGLILLPIYLHVLTPAEFGLLALVTLASDVLGVVLGLGLGRALLRLYVGATDDVERDHLVVSALALLCGLGVIVAALAEPIARLACRLIFSSDEHVTLFAYANLAVVFTVLFNFELSCLVARKASAVYLCASLSKTLLMLGLNITLVVYADAGVFGVVIGTLLSSVTVAGILMIELLRGRRVRGSMRAASALIKFGAPLILSVLLDTVVIALDKIALNRLATTAAVGGYAAGQRLSSLLQLFVVQPFMQIWAVRQLEVLDHFGPEERATLARIFDIFVAALCAAALAVSLFAHEILVIIAARSYAHAAIVVPLLALAEIVLLFRSYFEIGVFHANATRLLPWVSFATLLLAVPIYAGLISWLGMVGAALAFLLTAVLRVWLVAAVARRVSAFGQELHWRNVFAAVVVATIAYGVGIALAGGQDVAMAIMLKIGAVLGYGGVMYVSPVIGDDGRTAVAALARRVLRLPRQAGSSRRNEGR